MSQPPPRVLIVANDASARFGGEAILPLHYFRVLRARGVETWLVVHERNRAELTELFGPDAGRISYVSDSAFQRAAWRLGKYLPGPLRNFTLGLAVRLVSQAEARALVRRLIARHHIDVVHQPTPVSPKEVSLLYGLGVPVVIGPMNGGMTYPPAFRALEKRLVSWFVRTGRLFANGLNAFLPGKRRAATLLVANERTRQALPAHVRGRVVDLVENGVNLDLWQAGERRPDPERPVRFVFAGRFEHWKGIALLIEAFARLDPKTPAVLDIIGDGPLRAQFEAQAAGLNLGSRVRFLGWLPQSGFAAELRSTDVFVLPSLFECGGAVVLEAMAAGVPVIAARWGGPADYLDDTCGILVDPTTRESFVADLAAAMQTLAVDPALRERLAKAAREKVVREFDWERKGDRILEVYADAIRRHGSSLRRPREGG